MSRVFVYLSIFFILGISIRFSDCESAENIKNNTECEDVNIKPGSDETHLSPLEKSIKGLMFPFGIIRRNIFGKNNEASQSKIGGSFGSILEKFSDYVHAIAPGTLWCGSGDIAKRETDLGLFKKTDACCRAHDNCKNNILAGETEVNVKNNGIFTRSACACDHAFYHCLKNVSSIVSSDIGVTYFNILQPQCFQCICPTDDCNFNDGTECKDHCTKYEWIDNPKYIYLLE
ncbi:hypothetical protein P5V15_013631 [Pogonomyrmex californicus]